MSKKCKTCGKSCDGDYCFHHKPHKGFKKTGSLRSTSKLKSKKLRSNPPTIFLSPEGAKNYESAITMHTFFLTIWNKRSHKSEVSQEYLGKEPLSSYFHHILPKSKYPKLALIEENIILLTLDEHANVESDIYKYEEVNKRREILIKKYL